MTTPAVSSKKLVMTLGSKHTFSNLRGLLPTNLMVWLSIESNHLQRKSPTEPKYERGRLPFSSKVCLIS